MSLFGSCEYYPGPCPGCVNNQNLVPFIPPWVGKSSTANNRWRGRKPVYNGLNNTKNFRTYASSFVILKKSLTTVQGNNTPDPLSSWLGQRDSGSTRLTRPTTIPTNTGGPGDAVESVPIITSRRSGWKGRLVTLPHQTGVDVKHNSYERYLARKRGWAIRYQFDQCPSSNC